MFQYFYYFCIYNSLLASISLSFFIENEKLLNLIHYLINKGGVVSLKFCQWFFNNYQLIQDDDDKFSEKFENIYEDCDKHSISETRRIFSNDFGFPLEELLELESSEPIASGSIGQVYKCKMKTTGETVALKVKHPNIKYQLYYPIFLINLINNICLFFDIKFKLPININDFFSILETQINFNIEYNNCLHFYKIYENNKKIIIPKPILSSENVFISEYVSGEFFEDIDEINFSQKYKVALLFILFNRQCITIDGFIHADLHRGNWKIQRHGDDFSIVIYDFGYCFQIENSIMSNIWLGWETMDGELITNSFIKIIKLSYGKKDMSKIERDVKKILDEILIKPIDLSIIIKKIYKYLIDSNVKLTGKVVNFFIILFILDKIVKTYDIIDKNYNFTEDELNKVQFNTDYLNYINICEHYDVFHILCEKFRKNIKKYADFSDLFFSIEKKVGLDKVEIKNNNSTNIVLEL